MLLGRPVGRGPSGLVALLAQAAILFTVLATALVVALHGLRPDLRRNLLSTFAVGPYGRVMTLAFFLVAAAVLALAGALRAAFAPGGYASAIPRLLLLSAVAMAVAGAFPVATDAVEVRRWAVVHGPASQLSFAALTVSMLLLAAGCGADARWRHYHRTAWTITVVWAFTALFSIMAFRTPLEGIAQRLMIAVMVVWLVLTAGTTGLLLREPSRTVADGDAGLSPSPE